MRRAQRICDERGALSIEFLLVISAIMLVFLLMLQYAMQAYAHGIAQAAAEEALAAATTEEEIAKAEKKLAHAQAKAADAKKVKKAQKQRLAKAQQRLADCEAANPPVV